MEEAELEIMAEMILDIIVKVAMTLLSAYGVYFVLMSSGYGLEVNMFYTIVASVFFGIINGIQIRKNVQRLRDIKGVK